MIEIYKYQVESERKRIRERQAQGIAVAKQKGLFKGLTPNYQLDDPLLQRDFELYQSKKYTLKEVEEHTKIPVSTFKRYLQKYHIKR